MISLQHINKVFHPGTVNETRVFSDFNLSIDTGSFVSVVGSNGSGKTTMLNILGGTLPPDSGHVLLDEEDVVNKKEYLRFKTIGRVYQDPNKGVASSLTIAENMSLADNKGRPYGLTRCVTKKNLERYREIVSSVGLGLEDKMHVPMGVLSGGQRQAVSLLMATMTPIDILILDEHTAALDPKTADIIMEMTDHIIREKHLTAIMVTHNLRYAVEYGDRMIMMHEGKIVLDVRGEEKKRTTVDNVLSLFNEISVECGN